jgi:hypothetical protein
MTVFAHYDSEGNVRALISVEASEGFGAMVAPEPGLFVAEVDPAGSKLEADELTPETLSEIAKSHKVATPLPRAKLTKR